MSKFLAICVLGMCISHSSVLAKPLKNVFAVESNHGAAQFLDASFKSLPDLGVGAFYTASTTSATYQLAAKEYDPPLSQVISVYDHSQNKVKEFVHAESIVDNIKEEDKYGNSGDQHAAVGRFVVNGFEGFSNIINKLFEFPRTGQRLLNKNINEKLNQVGAKLVGL